MKSTDQQNRVTEAFLEWLRPENRTLQAAIERSVKEGLFSFPDIRYQLRALKKSHTSDAFQRWAGKYNLERSGWKQKKVLCLHAGNLPLAGLQDLLAAAMTGSSYVGKLSSKDPYLLDSLIDKLVDTNALQNPVRSTKLDYLQGTEADHILFSGSSSSLDPLVKRISSLKLSKKGTTILNRTAHFSLAYIESTDAKTMQELTEAVFRYGGKGCRSVAVVVSPYALDDIKCELTDYIESFWLKNPQHAEPSGSLFHRYAYNRAVGRSQAWLDHYLIEESSRPPEEPFMLHWVKGDRQKAGEFIKMYKEGLQSIYITSQDQSIPSFEKSCEPLHEAQQPPADWKPDGVDVVRWLLDQP